MAVEQTYNERVRESLRKVLKKEHYPEILRALRTNAEGFLDELGRFLLDNRDELTIIERANRYPKSLLCRLLGVQADEPLVLRDVSATGLRASVNKSNRLMLKDLIHCKVEIQSRRDNFKSVFPVHFVRLANETSKSLELCFRFGDLDTQTTIHLGTLLDLCSENPA